MKKYILIYIYLSIYIYLYIYIFYQLFVIFYQLNRAILFLTRVFQKYLQAIRFPSSPDTVTLKSISSLFPSRDKREPKLFVNEYNNLFRFSDPVTNTDFETRSLAKKKKKKKVSLFIGAWNEVY